MGPTVKKINKIIQEAFSNPLIESKGHSFVSLIQNNAGFVPFSIKRVDHSPILIDLVWLLNRRDYCASSLGLKQQQKKKWGLSLFYYLFLEIATLRSQ